MRSDCPYQVRNERRESGSKREVTRLDAPVLVARRLPLGPVWRAVEVYVNTDEKLCRERRPNADFSGFVPPRHPELTIALDSVRIDAAVEWIVEDLEKRGQF